MINEPEQLSEMHPPRWLEWAREIQALAQTGCQYAENEYQLERFQRLAGISAEIIAECNSLELEPISNLFQSQIGYATPRVDVRAVAKTVVLVDALMRATPRLAEIDINPLVAYPAGEGVLALDALMIASVVPSA